MRTTLTIEPDVADLLKEAIEREHSTLKDVVNEALRRGLRPAGSHPGLRVVPHVTALMPGLDPRGFNKLADELEDDVLIARMFPQNR
jgi:hypothetical protein